MSVLVTADTYIHYVVTINGNSYSVSYSGGKLSYNAIIPNEDLCFFKEVWVAESRSAIAPLSSQGTLAKTLIWDSSLMKHLPNLTMQLTQ